MTAEDRVKKWRMKAFGVCAIVVLAVFLFALGLRWVLHTLPQSPMKHIVGDEVSITKNINIIVNDNYLDNDNTVCADLTISNQGDVAFDVDNNGIWSLTTPQGYSKPQVKYKDPEIQPQSTETMEICGTFTGSGVYSLEYQSTDEYASKTGNDFTVIWFFYQKRKSRP